MNKNHWLVRLLALLIVCYGALLVSALAAGTPGTESDPLVTVSYLNDTFLTQLLGKVDEKLAARDKELSDKLAEQVEQGKRELQGQGGASGGGSAAAAGDAFAVVTLSSGQTLTGEVGCEVMLRVGTASCVTPSSPGLIDETDGTALNGGAALAQNHLYMMTVDGRGVKATAATVKLLVRGGYTIA